MKDINFDVPGAEYKEKPVRQNSKKEKFVGFLNEQKYIILTVLAFISMLGGQIWSMTINAAEINIKEFTLQALLYSAFNYAIFYFMTDEGRARGKVSEVYLNARKAYGDIHEKIRVNDFFSKLQEFCTWKKETVTDEYRRQVMLDSTITYDEYVEKWQGKSRSEIKKSSLDKQTKNCIIEANAYNTPKLVASALWEKSPFEEQATWVTKSGKKQLNSRRVYKAVRVFVLSALGISVAIDNVAHLDWSIFINVFVCAVSALLGYKDGFTAYAETEATCYETKTSLLTEAYDWAVEQKSNEKAE